MSAQSPLSQPVEAARKSLDAGDYHNTREGEAQFEDDLAAVEDAKLLRVPSGSFTFEAQGGGRGNRSGDWADIERRLQRAGQALMGEDVRDNTFPVKVFGDASVKSEPPNLRWDNPYWSKDLPLLKRELAQHAVTASRGGPEAS